MAPPGTLLALARNGPTATIGALRCYTPDSPFMTNAVGSHVSSVHKESICTRSFWSLTAPGYCLFCCMESSLGDLLNTYFCDTQKKIYTDLELHGAEVSFLTILFF